MAERSINVLVKERTGLKETIMPRGNYLTPLELFIVGGDVDTKHLVIKMDEAKRGNKETLRELLTPVALNAIKKQEEKQNIIDRINMAREHISQKGKFSGVFKIFDSKKLVDSSNVPLSDAAHLIKPVIELGPVSKEGQISPEWKIALMDGNGNNVANTDILSRLIKGKYSRFFSISKRSEDTGTVLKFNIDPQEQLQEPSPQK